MWGLESIDYRWVIGIAALVFVPAIAVGLFFSTLQLFGNFDAVIPGEFYRSAQPNAAQLEKYVQKHGIKSVLNLRGSNSKHKWYRNEVEAADALGVKFTNFRMSAHKQLPDIHIDALLTLLHDMPKPILVHCKSGADRTGLVAAIYLLKVAGHSQAEANRMISFRYGHIGIPYVSEAFAMDENWARVGKTFAAGS